MPAKCEVVTHDGNAGRVRGHAVACQVVFTDPFIALGWWHVVVGVRGAMLADCVTQ